jgi:hypothetical protein
LRAGQGAPVAAARKVTAPARAAGLPMRRGTVMVMPPSSAVTDRPAMPVRSICRCRVSTQGTRIALTLRSGRMGRPMAAADGHHGPLTNHGAGIRPLLQASCGPAQAFECMVCHCQVRQFGELPGDHFEGQNGATGRQCELAAASVS